MIQGRSGTHSPIEALSLWKNARGLRPYTRARACRAFRFINHFLSEDYGCVKRYEKLKEWGYRRGDYRLREIYLPARRKLDVLFCDSIFWLTFYALANGTRCPSCGAEKSGKYIRRNIKPEFMSYLGIMCGDAEYLVWCSKCLYERNRCARRLGLGRNSDIDSNTIDLAWLVWAYNKAPERIGICRHKKAAR